MSHNRSVSEKHESSYQKVSETSRKFSTVSEADKTFSTLPLEIRTTPISATASTHETPNIHLNNVHSKKFNTERFLRLSQRPSGYRTSPFLRYRLPTHSKLSDTSILGKSSNSKAIQVSVIINKSKKNH